MTKNNARKKAARARAAAERSSYVRAQRREREAGEAREPAARRSPSSAARRGVGVGASASPGDPLVYLDLNHYIYLAQALDQVTRPCGQSSTKSLPVTPSWQRRRGPHKAEGTGDVPPVQRPPMELSKVTDPRQRADVAAVWRSCRTSTTSWTA